MPTDMKFLVRTMLTSQKQLNACLSQLTSSHKQLSDTNEKQKGVIEYLESKLAKCEAQLVRAEREISDMQQRNQSSQVDRSQQVQADLSAVVEQAVEIITSNVHPHKYKDMKLHSLLRDRVTPTTEADEAIYEDSKGRHFKWTTIQRLNGPPHGKGVKKYEGDGMIEEAHYIKAKREGNCVELWTTGTRRISWCVNGQREIAVLKRTDGWISYGQFINDELQGDILCLDVGRKSMRLLLYEVGKSVETVYYDQRV